MLVNRGRAVVLVVVAGLALPPARPSQAATDPQSPPGGAASPAASITGDEQARDLFRARRYPEALAVYQRLRAETRHPTYLRNIGRCHQMMHQPSPAIAAFEAYLREAPDLSAAERAEVQDYIAEMRRLEAAPSPTTTAAPATAAAPAAPSPAEAPPLMVGSSPPALVAAPSPSDAGEPSLLRRWWFWAGVGALVVATGIVIGVAASGEDRLACPGGAVCP